MLMLDLDSLASSISFSYLSNALLAERAIPLVLTPPSLMQLRPENLFALQLASTPLPTLLHLSSLPSGPSSLAQHGAKFALVDHNKLLPIFENGKVVAILDHHQDDGEHLDANPRTIQVPTGSCAALVAKHFAPEWQAAISGPAGQAGSPVPPEVATLLLSSILIDTGGLKTKEGSKTTQTDLEAASFLWPLSTLGNTTEANFASEVPLPLKDLTQELLDTKSDVSRLSTHDLLIRDYKSYSLATSSVAFPVLKVGLSTVPMGLKTWLGRDGSGWDGLLDDTDAYMAEHDLDIEGILTTYRSDKGNHKRELVLILSSGAKRAITNDEQAERIFNELVAGLEADPVLDLGEWKKKSLLKSLDKTKKGEVMVAGDTFVKDGRWGKVWSQRNTSATRKQLQPVLVSLVCHLNSD